MVEREGFEPSKAYAGRFTVCSLWPLGYLSAVRRCNGSAAPSRRSPTSKPLSDTTNTMLRRLLPTGTRLSKCAALATTKRSRWPDSNWQPTDYKSVALPIELHRRSPSTPPAKRHTDSRPTRFSRNEEPRSAVDCSSDVRNSANARYCTPWKRRDLSTDSKLVNRFGAVEHALSQSVNRQGRRDRSVERFDGGRHGKTR